MVEPNIVFCSFNHIYDAALHAECPYCKKIKAGQEMLNKSLSEDETDESTFVIEDNEDATEILKGKIVIRDDYLEDESTELLALDIDEDESTELLISDSDEENVTDLVVKSIIKVDKTNEGTETSLPTLGWIVCNSGGQIGRSFEVVEGKNFICLDESGVSLRYEFADMSNSIAEVSVDGLKGEFYISAIGKNKVDINGISHSSSIIRNYDVLEINTMKFVFVELMTEFVNWGI